MNMTNKRFIFIILFLVGIVISIPISFAQDVTPTAPAPTLVPPTLVPTAPSDTLQVAEFSGIATIQNDGVLRVGARYNVPPFVFINERGEVDGYEIALMNSIGVELGISIEFVQVTRETEQADLLSGRVDALIGQQIHSRTSEQVYDFSHPYYLNMQRMVVLFDSPYQEFGELTGQPVSVVQGSPSERSMEELIAFGYDVRLYYTQKDALDALERGEVQGMVGELDNLSRAGRQGMRLITQPVRLDPYAIAVRRYDVNLRNALNRSIQRLWASGSLSGTFQAWFPSEDLDFDVLLPTYENLFTDARTIAEFNIDIPRPADSMLARIQPGVTIQVAGLSKNPDASYYDRLLDPFNQAIVEEMARRWGVNVEFIPNTPRNAAFDFILNGAAVMAVGVTPVWDGADRVDYSRPYAIHGDQLMVLEDTRFNSFRDFRGGSRMGYWYENPGDADRINEIAEALRVNTDTFEFTSYEQIVERFLNRTVNGLFADTYRLLAIIEETQTSGIPWKIVEEETYSRVPLAIAVPRNDTDFRSLVDWTLQDMFLDGTYQRIYNETFGYGEPIVILTWPGDGSWLTGQ